MLLGRQVRMRRLLADPSGKYLGVTVDHAMARGVFPGLAAIKPLVAAIVAGRPDALTMHKGIAERCFAPHAGVIPLVLKCTTFAPVHPKQDIQVTEVAQAVCLGADAISVGCIVSGEHQPHQIAQLGRMVDEAHALGMPALAHIYPRGLADETLWHLPEHVRYAVRLGAELGVDLVKTHYTGDPDSFATVVAAAPIPVAVAGGDNLPDLAAVLQLAHDVIAAGGIGITFGRCIIQAAHPTAVIRALAQVIHAGLTVREACEYYDELLHPASPA